MGSVCPNCPTQPPFLRHLSVLSSFQRIRNNGTALGLTTSALHRPRRHSVSTCCKMFVPGFGSQSPEAKAASTLHNYFTYLAVKIVLAQLEEYNPEAHKELMEFVDRTSLNDGDKFCATLMRESPRHKGLDLITVGQSWDDVQLCMQNTDNLCARCIVEERDAMRILEVRSAYASDDFEWDNVKKLAIKHATDSNTALMREFLRETSSME